MTYQDQLKMYGVSGGTCKVCGNPICWDNSRVYVGRNGDIKFSGRTHNSTKVVNGHTYHLQCCQRCFEQKFHRTPCFGTMCESTKWAYDISDEDYMFARLRYAMTKEAMIAKYGEQEGQKRWAQYCQRQAETNTFEYKQKTYGWTREQFDEYNQSRAVTLKNLISRYGEQEGQKRWAQYCQRQMETKSWDYLVKQYGEDKAREINRSKAITLENMIRVHGEIEGPKKYHKWLSQFAKREPQRWSKTSQKIFNEMRPIVESFGYTCKYQTHGGEYSLVTRTGGYLLDFYIPELKVGIEYNGSCFRADPRLYHNDEHCDPLRPHLTASEIREHDRIRKESIYHDHQIVLYELWELDYNEGCNIQEFIKNILRKHYPA